LKKINCKIKPSPNNFDRIIAKVNTQVTPAIQSNLYCKNTADITQLSNNVGREKAKKIKKNKTKKRNVTGKPG